MAGTVKLLGESRDLGELDDEQGRFGLCGLRDAADIVPSLEGAGASVLHGCAGWRKGRPVSMLRISPSCRTNTMLTVATTFRGRSDA